MKRADAEHSREGARRTGGPKLGGANLPGGGTFPIGSLARLAGVSTRTIRYYEEIGLLSTARRFSGGRRVFDGDALQRLRFIGRLKRLGFSLAEISHLNEVFAVHRSTAVMLEELDRKLDFHLQTIRERLGELTALREQLAGYRVHIRGRLTDLGERRRPNDEKSRAATT